MSKPDTTINSEIRKQIYGLAFAVETHPDDFVLRINQKGVEELLDLIAQEANKARLNEIEWAVAYAQSDLGSDFVDKGRIRIARLEAELREKGSNNGS